MIPAGGTSRGVTSGSQPPPRLEAVLAVYVWHWVYGLNLGMIYNPSQRDAAPPPVPAMRTTEADVLWLVPAGGADGQRPARPIWRRRHHVTKYPAPRTPRAHITNQRAVEVFRDLGIEDQVTRLRHAQRADGQTTFGPPASPARRSPADDLGSGPARKADYDNASRVR